MTTIEVVLTPLCFVSRSFSFTKEEKKGRACDDSNLKFLTSFKHSLLYRKSSKTLIDFWNFNYKSLFNDLRFISKSFSIFISIQFLFRCALIKVKFPFKFLKKKIAKNVNCKIGKRNEMKEISLGKWILKLNASHRSVILSSMPFSLTVKLSKLCWGAALDEAKGWR